jgi:DNA primase
VAAVRSPLPDHAAQVRAALVDPVALLRGLGLGAGARREGRRYVCRCPWHGEKNPSCSIEPGPNEGTLRARCFSCGAGGDVLALIAAVHQLDARRDFQRILDIGAGLAGIHLDRGPVSGASRPPRAAPAPPPAPAPRADPRPALSPVAFAAGVERLLALSPLGESSLAPGLEARGVLREALADSWGALPVDVGPLLPELQRPELAWLAAPGGLRSPEHRLLIPWRAPGGQIWTLQRRYAPRTGEEVPAKGGKYMLPDASQHRSAAEYPYGADSPDLQTAEELWLVEGAVDVLAVRALNAAGQLRGQRRSLVALGLAGVAHWPKVRVWTLAQARGRSVFLALDADRAGEDAVRGLVADFQRAGAVRVRRQRPGSGFKDWAEATAAKLGAGRQRPAPAPAPQPAAPEEESEPPGPPANDTGETAEERAARFGYRINRWGSWVELGEPDGPPPIHPRFAVGYVRSHEEERAHQELQRRIRAYCAGTDHQEQP